MNYAQKANAEIARSQELANEALAEGPQEKRLAQAQVHATLAVAYATLAVHADCGR